MNAYDAIQPDPCVRARALAAALKARETEEDLCGCESCRRWRRLSLQAAQFLDDMVATGGFK